MWHMNAYEKTYNWTYKPTYYWFCWLVMTSITFSCLTSSLRVHFSGWISNVSNVSTYTTVPSFLLEMLVSHHFCWCDSWSSIMKSKSLLTSWCCVCEIRNAPGNSWQSPWQFQKNLPSSVQNCAKSPVVWSCHSLMAPWWRPNGRTQNDPRWAPRTKPRAMEAISKRLEFKGI